MALSEQEEFELLSLEREKARSAKPSSLWDVIKREAAPDIFKSGQASYDLGSNVSEKTGSPALGYVANVATQALPVVVGAFGGAQAAPAFKEAGRSLMQSAIKPSAAAQARGKAAPAIETMLQQGHSPSNAGISAMRQKAADLSGQVRGITDTSTKMAQTQPAVQNLAALEAKVAKGLTGADDAEEVRKITAKLLQHPSVDDLGLMSVKEAQAMKELTQRKLGDAAYGLGLKPAAERDAVKAAGAGIRKAIEVAEPAVAPLNKKAAELMNAVKVSEGSVARQGNANPLPFGASVGAAFNNPVAALGLWANSSAAAKAMLARMLYSGSSVIPSTIGAAGGAKLGARQHNQGATEEERRRALAAALQEQR